jgi:hypothetical protein
MKKPRLSEEKPGFLDLGDKSPDLDVVELGGFEPLSQDFSPNSLGCE